MRLTKQTKCATTLNELIERQSSHLANQGQFQPDKKEILPDPNAFFTTSVLGMKAISQVIEDKAMELDGNRRLYTAFQKFSRFKFQEKRYRQILAKGIPTYLFGEKDASVWSDPNLHPVYLDASPSNVLSMAQFWFVVLYNPNSLSMALVSREVYSGWPTHLSDKVIYRNFEGFWTYDTKIIDQIVTALDDCIGSKRRPSQSGGGIVE